MTPEDLRDKLLAWSECGRITAIHIAGCYVCQRAEIARDERGYCGYCNRLWELEMKLELTVIEMLPELRAAGIDVDKDLRETGFKFMAKR